jgi:hypothetical protein
MITLLALAVPVALIGAFDAFASKLGSDSRPGFNEAKPLA